MGTGSSIPVSERIPGGAMLGLRMNFNPPATSTKRVKDRPVQFSRGHQVRLLDPCWSKSTNSQKALAESQLGSEDTFHYTNAAPQVQHYNDIDWGNLEDYLLDKAQTSKKLLTVFTGPIYRKDDPSYGKKRKGGPWKIPLSFWKVAVIQKTPKSCSRRLHRRPNPIRSGAI